MDMESAWTEWMDAVVSFSHLLSTVNSSINFVIYCYKDEKFRGILLKLICPESYFRKHPIAMANSRRTSNNTVQLNRTKTTMVHLSTSTDTRKLSNSNCIDAKIGNNMTISTVPDKTSVHLTTNDVNSSTNVQSSNAKKVS